MSSDRNNSWIAVDCGNYARPWCIDDFSWSFDGGTQAGWGYKYCPRIPQEVFLSANYFRPGFYRRYRIFRHLFGSFFIAFRFLNPPKQLIHFRIISIVSTISILVGCMSLICALSIENGFTQVINEGYFSLTPHLWIYDKNELSINHPDEVEKDLEKVPSIAGFAPYAERKGIIRTANTTAGVIILGIDANREKQVTQLEQQITTGTYLYSDTNRLPGIVLGAALASRCNLDIDSEITLMTLYLDADSNPSPKFNKFRVCGIFRATISELEMNSVYIDIVSAQKLFEIEPGSVQCYRARLKNSFHFKRALNEFKSFDRYKVETWVDREGLLFASMKMEKIVLIVTFSMIILMGIQGLSGTVRLLYLSKKRQIGILSALGMQNSKIMSVFFLNGLLRGTLASVAGILLGIFLCYLQAVFGFVKMPYDLYVIEHVPMKIELSEALFTLVGTVVASGVTSFISSRKVHVPNQYFRE